MNKSVKRKGKKENQRTLLYTTFELVDRLQARGRAIRFDVRDIAISWFCETDAQSIDWADLSQKLSYLPPMKEGAITFINLCKLLYPLHQEYDLQPINIAIALHTLTNTEIKNLYRFCYLEWMNVRESVSEWPETFWLYTPRQFSQLSTESLSSAWENSLHMFFGPEHAHIPSLRLFLLNRIYGYLLPTK